MANTPNNAGLGVIVGAALNTLTGVADKGGFSAKLQGNAMKTQDGLSKDILESPSANIVGYFLDTERCDEVDHNYREAALAAAIRLINSGETEAKDKSYLQRLISEIAEAKEDDLQGEAKELLLSCASESELSEIALDDGEDTDVRVNALAKMTDKDLLLDVAADSDDDDVRQAAKNRIKELR